MAAPPVAGQDGVDVSQSDVPSFEIPSRVLMREVDGEMVLLNLESEQYYGLDPVGANIVHRLTALSESAAFTALCEDYEVGQDVLRRDIDVLVARLLDVGLLSRVSSA